MGNVTDITGKTYGRLTVISLSHVHNGDAKWNCLCSCGKEVIVFAISLKSGSSKSCGCLAKELMTKHGEATSVNKSKEYKAWLNIKRRCYYTKYEHYPHYGGRGITVCERWIDSYDNFLSDLGRAPSPQHTVDRIDNNGNYEPSNCRWATKSQQMKNRRPWNREVSETKRKATMMARYGTLSMKGRKSKS